MSATSRIRIDPGAKVSERTNLAQFCPVPAIEPSSYLARISHVAMMMACIRSLEPQGVNEHARFIAAALLHRKAFLKLARPVPGGAFARLMAQRPEYLSLLMAPYIDARWSPSLRVDRLIDHASVLTGALRKYDFPVSHSLPLLDLGDFALPGYAVVLDKPIWFCREGLITVNLFKDRFRLFSITFSFYSQGAGLGVIIGGIQGRKTDNILGQYRDFTKLAHGLRPRDFLLEVLRIIARAENATRLRGVQDQHRYHRHRYFMRNKQDDLHLDYDEVWSDRGGLLTSTGLYDMPLAADRTLDRISVKKRAMYRRRYDLLDRMEPRIVAQSQTALPVLSAPFE